MILKEYAAFLQTKGYAAGSVKKRADLLDDLVRTCGLPAVLDEDPATLVATETLGVRPAVRGVRTGWVMEFQAWYHKEVAITTAPTGFDPRRFDQAWAEMALHHARHHGCVAGSEDPLRAFHRWLELEHRMSPGGADQVQAKVRTLFRAYPAADVATRDPDDLATNHPLVGGRSGRWAYAGDLRTAARRFQAWLSSDEGPALVGPDATIPARHDAGGRLCT